MIKMINFRGRNVVAPLTGKDKEMVADLKEYFPDGVDQWFASNESDKKAIIRKRDDYKCLFCEKETKGSDVHEIVGKGSAGGDPALVPWNQATICRYHHELLQQYKWTIYRFDPLDKENGLIVIGQDGKPIPKNKLWFYNRPDPLIVDEAYKRFSQLQEYAEDFFVRPWTIAPAFKWLADKEAYKVLGYDSHASMIADTGCPVVLDKLARRVWGFLEKEQIPLHKVLGADMRRIDRIRRVWPQMSAEEREDWLGRARTNSDSDFNSGFRSAFGGKRNETLLSIVLDNNSGPMLKLITGKELDDIEGDVVVKVGEIKRGRNKIIEEA